MEDRWRRSLSTRQRGRARVKVKVDWAWDEVAGQTSSGFLLRGLFWVLGYTGVYWAGSRRTYDLQQPVIPAVIPDNEGLGLGFLDIIGSPYFAAEYGIRRRSEKESGYSSASRSSRLQSGRRRRRRWTHRNSLSSSPSLQLVTN